MQPNDVGLSNAFSDLQDYKVSIELAFRLEPCARQTDFSRIAA